MRLSILICSLESRNHLLQELLDTLNKQILPDVEILTNIDNRQKSTGKKRQELLNLSQGEYVVFIDDDDSVPDYYISKLLTALESNPDCVSICGTMTTNGAKEIGWRLSKDYENITITENGKPFYLRKTNHITAVKRNIATLVGFPDKSNAEDKYYSDGINQYLKTESIIKQPMYHYKYETTNKQY